MSKVGIILANTGTPAAPTSDAVAEYLRSFLADPRICPMNPHLWRFVLNRFIIPRRAPASAAKYASIWTDAGSPLDAGMKSLVRKVGEACNQGPSSTFACCAMCYSTPTIEEALESCRSEGCDEVVIVPLYPQSAFSTTGVVRDRLDLALKKLGWAPKVRFVESYCDASGYVEAIAASITNAGFDAEGGDRVLFAFHSIPMSDIRAGDIYAEQCQQTTESVAESLGIEDGAWRAGFQCRFDKSRAWLGPSTKEVLPELVRARRLFVVAPNFSIDCLETLYDIQVELKSAWMRAARTEGDGRFCYVPCLGDSNAHADLVREVCSKACGFPV